jgi:hypothetical protein
LYSPRRHASQEKLSLLLLRPLAHRKQGVDALSELFVHPAGQAKQNVSPSRLICPGGQSSQSFSLSCSVGVSALSLFDLPGAQFKH